MATPVVANDVVRLKAYCQDQDEVQIGENVTHWSVASVTGALVYQDVANAMSSRLAVPYKNWLASTCRYYGASVQRIGPAPISQTFTSTSGQGVGTAGLIASPNQVSGLIHFQTETLATGLTGKKYFPQGRIFIPFPSIQWVDGPGTMTPGGFSQLGAIRDAYGTTVTITMTLGRSFTLNLIVYRRRDANSYLTTSIYPVSYWTTMKKRGEYGRQNREPF